MDVVFCTIISSLLQKKKQRSNINSSHCSSMFLSKFSPLSLRGCCLIGALVYGNLPVLVHSRGSSGGTSGGGRPSPSRPSPTPPRPSPTPPWPSPTFSSPSFPSGPTAPSPFFPSPSFASRPPPTPSGSRVRVPAPVPPSNNNGSPQDCFQRQVNVTNPTTNETKVTTETICGNNSSSGGGSSTGMAVGIFLAAFTVGMGVVVYLVCSKSAAPAHATESRSWVKVRQQVQNDAAGTVGEEYGVVQPADGTFKASYQEAGKTHEMIMHLRFTPTERGVWTLQGNGQDHDGSFVVLEGILSPTGVVYWIDQCSSNKVLSQGRFNNDITEMEGTWEADNGVTGSYQNFCREVDRATESPSTEDEINFPLGHDDEPEITVKESDDPETQVKTEDT